MIVDVDFNVGMKVERACELLRMLISVVENINLETQKESKTTLKYIKRARK